MRPLLVGIAGGSASGKSTLSKAVVEALGDRGLLVLHDRYYKSLPPHLEQHPLDWNFDHPISLETERMVADLAELRAGRTARLPVYDYATHRRRPTDEEVPPRPVIIVEGILVLAIEGLRDVLDKRVFVSVPDDVRLIRRIRRDTDTRGREIHQILEQYERTVRPMHQRYVEPSRTWADLVVDGQAPLEASMGMVLDLIARA